MSQTTNDPADATASPRRALVEQIVAEVAATSGYLGKDRLDPRVLAAIGKVPRHLFVPPSTRERAYDNAPQPIGHGQTISQPYMVAVMTDLAAVGPQDRVLEVGTGCGYQAAVLAELAAEVYTIEVVSELAGPAAKRLQDLGYANITARQGDGALGWPEKAPFDAIVVTAAAWHRAPAALVAQLAPGGRLVIPIDRSHSPARYPFYDQVQDLVLITRDADGRLAERVVLPVAFVPLIGGG